MAKKFDTLVKDNLGNYIYNKTRDDKILKVDRRHLRFIFSKRMGAINFPYNCYKIKLDEIEEIIYRDDFQCQYCGKRFEYLYEIGLDHILPRAKGGDNFPENLTVSCNNCNSNKHTKYYTDFDKEIKIAKQLYSKHLFNVIMTIPIKNRTDKMNSILKEINNE